MSTEQFEQIEESEVDIKKKKKKKKKKFFLKINKKIKKNIKN